MSLCPCPLQAVSLKDIVVHKNNFKIAIETRIQNWKSYTLCVIGQFTHHLYFCEKKKETHLNLIVVNATISEQAL